jgi:hypothetical protein
MRGGSCAASGTSATEHPFNLFLSRTGVWGYPPDKRLSEANQLNIKTKQATETRDGERLQPSRGFSR